MSRTRVAFVVAAMALLALALYRHAPPLDGATAGDAPTGRTQAGPCATCARELEPARAVVLDGPDTADVLASLGYEVVAAAPPAVSAPAADADDAAWTRPMTVAHVRRLPVVPSASDAARPRTAAAATPSAVAATGPIAVAAPAAQHATIPVGASVAGAERVVRDGILLLAPGNLVGTPIHRAADGKLRITNLSGGDYSVMFFDPVTVDGLVIPPKTEMPVTGQLEIDVQRDSHIVVLPHASAWPSPGAPTTDG